MNDFESDVDDPRFASAVRLFNQQEYFECHDVLEEIWTETLSTRREFYQGLIHAAVSLFHFSEGNLGGARKMYHSCLSYLSGYGSCEQGIDLDRFRTDYAACFAELIQPHKEYPAHLVLHSALIPQLHVSRDQT